MKKKFYMAALVLAFVLSAIYAVTKVIASEQSEKTVATVHVQQNAKDASQEAMSTKKERMRARAAAKRKKLEEKRKIKEKIAEARKKIAEARKKELQAAEGIIKDDETSKSDATAQ